jgi:hypothetical protein
MAARQRDAPAERKYCSAAKGCTDQKKIFGHGKLANIDGQWRSNLQPEIDMAQWWWDADWREGGGGMAMGAKQGWRVCSIDGAPLKGRRARREMIWAGIVRFSLI